MRNAAKVGDKPNNRIAVSSDRIRSARDAWKLAEDRLARLAFSEDQILGRGDGALEEVDRSTAQLDAMQTTALSAMLSLRSENISDVCVKLSVWLEQRLPSGSSDEDFTQTDQLAAQAIRELMSLTGFENADAASYGPDE